MARQTPSSSSTSTQKVPAPVAAAPKTATPKPEATQPQAPNTLKAEAPAPRAEPQPAGPTHEQIARRAHALFVARGGQHGHHLDDWLRAERELRQGAQ
jgi:hypothetical protein